MTGLKHYGCKLEATRRNQKDPKSMIFQMTNCQIAARGRIHLVHAAGRNHATISWDAPVHVAWRFRTAHAIQWRNTPYSGVMSMWLFFTAIDVDRTYRHQLIFIQHIKTHLRPGIGHEIQHGLNNPRRVRLFTALRNHVHVLLATVWFIRTYGWYSRQSWYPWRWHNERSWLIQRCEHRKLARHRG